MSVGGCENIMRKTCVNCKYYWADAYNNEDSNCSIDGKKIHPDISDIVKCPAFSEWFGAVE